ncbi:hypothetical protein MKX01_021029 [Papaver californicum]|nr:hypothetical protein MKX01_021029 [Papaver californicum]
MLRKNNPTYNESGAAGECATQSKYLSSRIISESSTSRSTSSRDDEKELGFQDLDSAERAKRSENLTQSGSGNDSSCLHELPTRDVERGEDWGLGGPKYNCDLCHYFLLPDTLLNEAENGAEIQIQEDFPEVKAEFQETFLGHTSPISRCRFSASGNNIASASVDGTVRIWTYDSSSPTTQNATIYCGSEIMSLDWECKSDCLLLIGTADRGIKAWNVDAKRVVCDLSTTASFPSVLDLKCSPVEPIFVSAAASRGHCSSNLDRMGFASLTVWNMKTWKAMSVLPLGEDPPAITPLCFNHNGKILAASATDGMIHMFDMAAGLQLQAGLPMTLA